MYALADCNNFFVSCERIFRPDLRNKPVVVLSGNDGCVIARSNEVKALGIKMGVPFYQIKTEIAKYGIEHFSSNFPLYGDISARIMRTLSRHTAELQQYSIDEAFLDLSHINDTKTMRNRCLQLRADILKGIGVPISFGIASTKTLCKVAADYSKHYAGYKGVCVIDTEERRIKALAEYPIADVWGIGRQSAAKLQAAGIKTALDFANRPEIFAHNLLHLPGVMTWCELNDIACIENTDMPQKQSITCSRTFAHPVTNRDRLEQALSEFCDNVAHNLRKQHSVCRQMVVFAHTSRFNDDMRAIQQTISFEVPTANTRELTEALLQTVRRQWQADTPYKRAGVILLSIEPDNGVQQSLFDTRDRERDNRLQRAMDAVNDHLGKHSLTYAHQLPAPNAKPLYETGTKSPAYTTDITQILTLKC